RDRRNQALNESNTDTHTDQGEHVRRTELDGVPGALKEGPTAPEDDGRGEYELNPRNSSRSVIKKVEEHVAHRQSEKRNAENQTDDEPPRHVREFGVLYLHGCSYARLQGHATDRTGAGLFANYLRVHRADVLDLIVRRRRKFGFQGHSAGWTGVRSGRVNLGAHGTDVFGRALGVMRSFDRANATPFPRGWRKRRLCDWSDRRLGPELNNGAAHGV